MKIRDHGYRILGALWVALWLSALVGVPLENDFLPALSGPTVCWAQSTSENGKKGAAGEQKERGKENGQKGVRDAQDGDSSENITPSPDEGHVPLQTETLDEAGEMLGKKIDEVSKDASKRWGKWITAKAFWGISWLKLIVCLVLIILVVVVDRVIQALIALKIRRERPEHRTASWLGFSLQALSKPLSLFVRVYGLYWALSPIWSHFETAKGTNLVHEAAGKVADVGGTFAFFWFIYLFIDVMEQQLRRWTRSSESVGVDNMLIPLVGRTFRVFVIVVGGIVLVQNLTGIAVGPLLASLGIGGLAFALAGKDSIANFFGSLTILLDKPFQVGERIVFDNNDGIVESVGFRSTRLRTLTGHLVSIPNEKIINSTLENIGQRPYIRWHTNLTITYDTPPEKVESAVQIIRDILDNHEAMDPKLPPQVHFNGFNDWSLNISIYAWYHNNVFWFYQEWVQKTCLEIMRRFAEEGIEFAFPTQTLVHSAGGAPLQVRLRDTSPRG